MSSGDVTIELAGEKVVLRPTFKSFRVLMAQYGTLTSVLQKASLLDVVAFRDIITAGAGKELSDVEEMDEAIFKAGVANLVDPLTKFVAILANGGIPLGEAAKSEGKTDGKKQ